MDSSKKTILSRKEFNTQGPYTPTKKHPAQGSHHSNCKPSAENPGVSYA